VGLDGFHLKVRLALRVVSAPVLAVLGIAEDGRKILVSLRLVVSEAGIQWRAAIEDLEARGMAAPRLIVSDGHKDRAKAKAVWPEAKVQRCTQHKWANLNRLSSDALVGYLFGGFGREHTVRRHRRGNRQAHRA